MTEEAVPHVVVNPADLSPAAFEALVEEFITREGTDYGHEDHALAEKVAAVRRQISRGEARIVFDPELESVNIIPVR